MGLYLLQTQHEFIDKYNEIIVIINIVLRKHAVAQNIINLKRSTAHNRIEDTTDVPIKSRKYNKYMNNNSKYS
uniref:Uncharacterized protein n=1 Tax=Octopus bimaculoides TaxID=37653 RepID=A0A0L8GG25_OCTBM